MFLGLTERGPDLDEYHCDREDVGRSRRLAHNPLPWFFGEGKAMD
jgi:hypothetical protein